ncbi:MAG: ferrous iron transport protein A [Bacteroidia bacterium]|nr:ferrous iron transport protein A [Bacteroidia bacterium]
MLASELNIGERAVISKVGDGALALKLMEMGCYEGEQIRVKFKAPFGDPIAFEISGYHLALRKDEAQLLEVILI